MQIRNEKIRTILLNSLWFQNECKLIRKKYRSSLDEKYLSKEVKRICKLLPAYWENSVRDYIKNEKLVAPNIGAQIVFQEDKDSKQKQLFIRIFQKTTMEDVKQIWKDVRKFQKILPEVLAPYILDDLEILRIWDEVESREKKPRNISREVSILYKGNLSENDIRKRVSNLKKILQAGQKSPKK